MNKCQNLEAKILIIDDDHVSNLLIESILNNQGFMKVKSITNPLLALEQVTE
jgi:PleD family two-component response regulator